MESMLPEMTESVQWITHSVVVAGELEALHKRVGLDIIDFPEWAAEGFTWLLNRTERETVPTVIQLHGPLVMLAHTIGWPDTQSVFYKTGTFMEASCVRLTDGLYSSSACSAGWIREHYDKRERKIPVIHLGINVNVFYPRPASSHPLTILFIGKLVQNKGIEELIEASLQIRKDIPFFKVIIAGTGEKSYIASLQKKAAGLQDTGQLEFTGHVAQEKLPELLSEADVLAAPSYYEGGPGFVYLEAMACGVPVIACSGSGAEEIIEQNVTGVLVPPKNVTALATALQRTLCDKTFSESIRSNALSYILKECERDHCLRKLEAYYLTVIRACASR